MKYVSTRGAAPARGFSDILLEGLAPDGGLYVPETYPRLDAAQLEGWRSLPYPALAFEILRLYVDDVRPGDLRAIVDRTYTAAAFGSEEIVPLRRLADGTFLLGLSNGPTLAFKDIALQLVGNLFAHELARRGEHLNVVGATSGDTGSAAEHALRGKPNVAVFMLSPRGRMSAFQQAQMYGLQDANIHNLAVAGTFDDCQDIVKAIGADAGFKRRHHVGAVNSINWARVLAQVVYYAWGWLRATTEPGQRVSFAVPSGNFGNVCAGHVARMMGVPIDRLVVATNENDVLAEFFATGVYRPRTGAETHATSSPSMDIARASNLERFVFDLLDRDAARTAAAFRSAGGFALDDDERSRLADFGFAAGTGTHADRVATIRRTFDRSGVVVDPHTADALHVAAAHATPGVPMVVLETALPAKFAATIREAIGREPDVPAAHRGIESLPHRVVALPADAAAVRAYIEAHALT